MHCSVSNHLRLLFVCAGFAMAMGTICTAAAKKDDTTDPRRNVVFIICDDLNDYI